MANLFPPGPCLFPAFRQTFWASAQWLDSSKSGQRRCAAAPGAVDLLFAGLYTRIVLLDVCCAAMLLRQAVSAGGSTLTAIMPQSCSAGKVALVGAPCPLRAVARCKGPATSRCNAGPVWCRHISVSHVAAFVGRGLHLQAGSKPAWPSYKLCGPAALVYRPAALVCRHARTRL